MDDGGGVGQEAEIVEGVKLGEGRQISSVSM